MSNFWQNINTLTGGSNTTIQNLVILNGDEMKKMMLISLIILILVTSCKDDTTSPVIKPLNTDELIPLKIGNTWVYEHIIYNGSDQKTIQETITVESEIQYKNEKHFIFKHTDHSTGKIKTPKVYYINKADGHYMIYLELYEDIYTIKLNYPTFEGDIIYEDGINKYYIEKVDTIYTTPAGKFKCIKYVQSVLYDGKDMFTYINYIAPGIGRVVAEVYRTDPKNGIQSINTKSILLSYKLN